MKGYRYGCLITLIIMYLLYEYFLAYGFTRIFYFIIQPKDIKVPLVREEFQFDKEGYEREYRIKPKYRGVYYVLINFENFDMLWEEIEKCKGKIEISYFRKNRLVKKSIEEKFYGYLLSRSHGNWCGSIRLDKFDYYNSIFRWDIDRIVVKVNKPMACFPKGRDKKTYLVIRYSYDL